ncbi:MAG: hypothetical protein AAGI28_11550 [Pseudomonadota bacterium]
MTIQGAGVQGRTPRWRACFGFAVTDLRALRPGGWGRAAKKLEQLDQE